MGSIVTERFLKYVSFSTASNDDAHTVPSSPGQLALGKALVAEMKEIGIADASIAQHGIVTGTIPASDSAHESAAVIGFIAHMDTVFDVSGENIKTRIVNRYDGGDILLNPEKGIVLSPSEFSHLLDYKGQDLIVTDGTTLLGSDDKAGIAEIMTAAEILLKNENPHGAVKIAFTPDEEIGTGIAFFDVAKFGAQFAYTVDGGKLGEIEYECFNGASVHVHVTGQTIHPGEAKNKMINAALLAMEYHSLLPRRETPDNTEAYEGFLHLMHITGTTEQADLSYIVRYHDHDIFTARKKLMCDIAAFLNAKYGQELFTVTCKDSYRNMREQILPHFHLIRKAEKAMTACGVTPRIAPVRGGTDGARLSFEGLPCPNLSTGGHNFHGVLEYIPVQSMEKMVDVIVTIASLYGQVGDIG